MCWRGKRADPIGARSAWHAGTNSLGAATVLGQGPKRRLTRSCGAPELEDAQTSPAVEFHWPGHHDTCR